MNTKKDKMEYSIISYFCGCGGLDLGFRGNFSYKGVFYKKQPFKILNAYDFDEACVETYNNYFGEKQASKLDLSDADPRTISKAEILVGGFPCQEFSSCGPLGGLDSERGKLYKSLIKYMEEHKPKVVVGENVINLQRMEKGKVLSAIVDDMESPGYKVEVWKLHAPDYGVPQRRTRLFFICVRNDLEGVPTIPKAKFEEKHRTVEWAIGDLIDKDGRDIPNQDEYFVASRAKKGNGQGDESSNKDKPAYTIRANPKSRVQFHYSLDRRLTVRECARLQTFPDDFMFNHAKTRSISQIGNAVPPILAYAVASSVAKYMKNLEESK